MAWRFVLVCLVSDIIFLFSFLVSSRSVLCRFVRFGFVRFRRFRVVPFRFVQLRLFYLVSLRFDQVRVLVPFRLFQLRSAAFHFVSSFASFRSV